IDQTRGWFYSLIAISTYMTGKSPYKNVLVNDLILDKDGKKMSKSRGNTVAPFELFDKYGADVVRWYLLYVSPPWTPTKFDEDGLREIESKFFRSLRNTYNFFSLYANTDNIDPRETKVSYDDLEEIDKWLLSKYNRLVKNVRQDMNEFELTKVVREIQEFVIEDVSNWYIRRNRRRFWKTDKDNTKIAVYKTTYEVLLGVTKLIAPIVPFISEELFKSLSDEESVHLVDYPNYDENMINDKIEEKMDLVRDLVTLGRASREEAKIKVRQPLSKVIIDGKYQEIIGDLTELIKEELNVKEVQFEENLSEYMEFELKPNFKVCGKILGSKVKSFGKVLSKIDAKDFLARLNEGDVNLEIDGEKTEIKKDYVEVKISAKEGFDVIMENNLFVILDTELTEELLEEGYVREFVSKIQQLRKKKDLDILDNIKIAYKSDEEVEKAIAADEEFIKSETLALEIKNEENDAEVENLNGHDIKIKIEKI
ncbi:DUF5915 domain-containing protein, partial [Peptoniphilus rhinitidis]